MGKVSDQINQFTETYSTIVLGMHNDINQYRREVQSLKKNNSEVENNLYRILNNAKLLEESNNKIYNRIDDKKSEIESFYREIAGSARRISVVSEKIDVIENRLKDFNIRINVSADNSNKLKIALEEEKARNLNLKSDYLRIQSSLTSLNNKVSELDAKHSRMATDLFNSDKKLSELISDRDLMKNTIEEQANQLHLHKLLIIGCSVIIVLILFLTILL